jgi:ribonuclease P protein component
LQFPRSVRLLRPEDFRLVFERPQRAKSAGLMVLARSNGLPHPRLGLAVSKKSLPLAVQRNRIKRLSRDVFRHLQHQLGGIDIVILSRHELARQDNARIRQALQQHLTTLASRCDKLS